MGKSGEQGWKERKITVGASEREAMSGGNLGVCEGWRRCVVKGKKEGSQQIEGVDMGRGRRGGEGWPGGQVGLSLSPD